MVLAVCIARSGNMRIFFVCSPLLLLGGSFARSMWGCVLVCRYDKYYIMGYMVGCVHKNIYVVDICCVWDRTTGRECLFTEREVLFEQILCEAAIHTHMHTLVHTFHSLTPRMNLNKRLNPAAIVSGVRQIRSQI